ncbi:MAG: hypothetical protein C3F08_04350 [Candidatus Methylomirabilota bacterium]|nr:MAG: hypothetical protein C3F08_04350 [candidate division NC10 bacterium]
MGKLPGIRAACWAIVLVIASWPAATHAKNAEKVSQPIPAIKAQPLAKALQEFSELSGLQFAYESRLANGLQSPGTPGDESAEKALCELLVGTGLDYRFVDSHTVAIEKRLPGAVAKPCDVSQATGAAGVSQVTPTDQAQQQAEKQEGGQKGERGEEGEEAPETAPPPPLERFTAEVIVTPQKREEELQDVPISITTLVGEVLDEKREEGLTEVLRTVPAVAAPVTALGTPSIAIRGVTADFLAFGGAPTASYYIDSVPYGFVRSAMVPDADLYDLERIEVLRGPQGTLFGANAQSGVVRILTHDPDLSAFETKVRGSVSSTEGGGTNYRGDLAVNLPLIEEKLAARAVLGYTDRSGWIDKPGTPNADSADITNARLKVLGKPTEKFSLMGSYWYTSSQYANQSIGNNGENITPTPEPVNSDAKVYELRADYYADAVVITSATSYFDYGIDSSLDLTPLGPWASGIVQKVDFGSKVFCEELGVISTGAGPWRWSAGASYRDDTDRFIQHFSGMLAADYEDSSRSWAVFGELTRAFLDEHLELTVGLRYFDDSQNLDENISATLDPDTPLVHAQASFDRLTPRTVLTWHPNDDLAFYASYAQGFRSGLTQQPNVLVVAPWFPPAEPDLLSNYELGTKGSPWGGRLQFEAAVFFLDWKDMQLGLSVEPSTSNPAMTAMLNASSASGLGAEFSFTVTPVERFLITSSFSWNDLTFDSDVISLDTILFFEGSRIPYSPEYTAGLALDYYFLVGRGFNLLASLSGNYTSAIEYTQLVNGVLMPQWDGDAIPISRASVTLSARKNWSLTLFVDNLNDERGPTTRGEFPETWYALNTRPRTFGLQVEFQL